MIKFHSNQFQSLPHNCTIQSCSSIAFNYRTTKHEKPNKNKNDNEENFRRQAFEHILHHQHEQLYHRQRSLQDHRLIMDKYPNYRNKLARFVHNGYQITASAKDTNSDKSSTIKPKPMANNINTDNNDELETFETGDVMMNFKRQNSSRYIWCRAKSLKEEWLSYNVTVANWNTALNIARIKSRSKCIRNEFICRDEHGQNQEMSVVRILVLHQYTANDDLQLELCKISRQSYREFKREQEVKYRNMIMQHMDDKETKKKKQDPWSAYKKEHAKFGHTYKLLAETIEKYGRDIMRDKEYDIVYRGIGILPKFKSAVIACFTPTSTTKTWAVAAIFGSNGCVLEMHPDERMQGIGVDMEPFSQYPLEYEVLFYGDCSYLRLMKLYNGVVKSACYSFGPFALIEACVTPPLEPGDLMYVGKRSSDKGKRKKLKSKSSMIRRYGWHNYIKEATELLGKYIRWKGLDSYSALDDSHEAVVGGMDEGSMSCQSKEILMKLEQSESKIIDIDDAKYEDDEEKENPQEMQLRIGAKGCKENEEIQMRQLQFLISSILEKNRYTLYVMDDILVKCINAAFGTVDLRNITAIFEGVHQMEFGYDVDQKLIIKYISNEFQDGDQDKLWRIRIKPPLREEYRKQNKLDGFCNNALNQQWELFEGRDHLIWKR